MKTTLGAIKQIKGAHTTPDYWDLLGQLNASGYSADDAEVPFPAVVKVAGLRAALWCLRAEPSYAAPARLFAVWCARQALSCVPNPDRRCQSACDVAERFARGKAAESELRTARIAARKATEAAEAAGNSYLRRVGMVEGAELVAAVSQATLATEIAVAHPENIMKAMDSLVRHGEDGSELAAKTNMFLQIFHNS